MAARLKIELCRSAKNNLMTNQTPSLRIGLLDNSCHSLKRGYEMWSQWKRSKDAWLLKESVIWVHHGIELALKQLLVQTNEFLVFDDVNRAVERLGILRRKKGMTNAGVLDLFDYDDKVMSVGFKNLIERTAITLSIPELTENEHLRLKIDELTKYRNKMVHFSIELDIAGVSNLLSDILDPLLSMLAREVKDANFKENCIPEIRNIAQPVQKFSKQIYDETETRIAKILQHFDGQKVSGSLFGVGDEIYLPKFTQVSFYKGSGEYIDIDLTGTNENQRWLVDIKFGSPNIFFGRGVSRLKNLKSHYPNSQIWLVVMIEVPKLYSIIKESGILFSSIKEVEQLEKILSINP